MGVVTKVGKKNIPIEKTTLEEWTEPSRLIPIAIALASLWVALGIKSPTRKVTSEEKEVPNPFENSNNPPLVDTLGESY